MNTEPLQTPKPENCVVTKRDYTATLVLAGVLRDIAAAPEIDKERLKLVADWTNQIKLSLSHSESAPPAPTTPNATATASPAKKP